MDKTAKTGKFGFDFRVLAILLLLSAAPLLLGSWWLFKNYEDAYLENVGESLSLAAETAFGSLNNFFQNQIIEIGGLTEVPTIRQAVESANQTSGRSVESARKEVEAIEASWPSLGEDSTQLKSILDNPAGRFLHRYTSINRSYHEIMVTDSLGRLVAASGKTTDYFQGDEGWWQNAIGDGRAGSVYVGDVVFDDSTKTHALELAQPIVNPEGGVIGVIKVILGAHAIHSIIGSFQAGPTGNAALLRSNGDVISAPGYSITDQAVYPAIREILNTRNAGRRYFVSMTDPEAIYGLSGASFLRLYPQLDWLVITTVSVDDVLGPLSRLQTYFLYFVLAILLLCLVSTMLVSRLGTEPVVTDDPHLERL
jgi:hypothetical protein